MALVKTTRLGRYGGIHILMVRKELALALGGIIYRATSHTNTEGGRTYCKSIAAASRAVLFGELPRALQNWCVCQPRGSTCMKGLVGKGDFGLLYTSSVSIGSPMQALLNRKRSARRGFAFVFGCLCQDGEPRRSLESLSLLAP